MLGRSQGRAHARQARAKRSPSKACSDNPVAREYALGESIGLEGTPGIVASNGAMLGGYLAPDALLEALQENSVAH